MLLAEATLPERVANFTLGVGVKKPVESRAELVPEDETTVDIVARQVVVTPQLVGQVEYLTLLGHIGALQAHNTLRGVVALVDGDAATHVACRHEVLFVTYKVGRAILEIDTAAVGLHTLGARPGEILVDILYPVAILQPSALGVQRLAACPEEIQETLLLLDAGLFDKRVYVATLHLVGDGSHTLQILVELVLVVDATGKGERDRSLLDTRILGGIAAEESHLLVQKLVVVAVADIDDEVVVARRQLADIHCAENGHYGVVANTLNCLSRFDDLAGFQQFDIRGAVEILLARLVVDVVNLAIIANLLDLLGEEVVHVRLHIVAAARQDVGLDGRLDIGHHLQTRHSRTLAVVEHNNILLDDGGLVVGVFVLEADLKLVQSLFDGETLHIEEIEMVSIEAGNLRAGEVVFLDKLDGVVAPDSVVALDGDEDLDNSLVFVARLDEVQIPGVEGDVCLDVGTYAGMIESGIREYRREMLVVLDILGVDNGGATGGGE